MQLKILSWNIWFNCYFDQVMDFLKIADADILALQEVVLDDKKRDVIGFLTGLGYQHVFAEAFKVREDGRTVGNAVFSRYKIIDSRTHQLPDVATRNAIQADIDVNGQILHVFSTHLLHSHLKPSEEQTKQAEKLIEVLPADNTILLGDFNATPDQLAVKKMEQVSVNTDPKHLPTWSVYAEGCHVCKPQKLDICFDYIFASKDIKFDSFKVGDSKGSDHLPISINVEI